MSEKRSSESPNLKYNMKVKHDTSGRPPKYGKAMVQVTIKVTEDQRAWMREAGMDAVRAVLRKGMEGDL